jgi:hypothetical protein
VAFPQPEPSEQPADGNPPPPSCSRAGSPPAGMSPAAVWFTVCAWCERVRIGDRWLESPRAFAVAEAAKHEPQLTHGICPACFEALTARRAERRFGTDAAA